jgi:UDP-N-acetylmuramate dehydrogenase
MTTFGIGGPARFFADIRREEDLYEALAFAKERELPIFVLGGGSNLLVADRGFPGLVLHIAIEGIVFRDEEATVSAGEDWDGFVAQCVRRNLAGVEALSGIPGQVGGTPVQNVGAYGQEVSETIVGVRAFDRQTECIVELDNAGCGFSYRTSIFNTTAKDRYVVLAVTYNLKLHGEPALRYPDVKNYFAGVRANPTLTEVREAVRSIRMRKAMVIVPGDPDCRSAGSFFKNPVITSKDFIALEASSRSLGLLSTGERIPSYPAPDGNVKVPAAWLIERAGFCRGYVSGRVGISSKHTLALINRGGAKAREMLDLAEEIQGRVEQQFRMRLVPEPVFVGF